jgi:hypothetical protein
MALKEYAPLHLAERKMKLTMNFQGLRGNKGFEIDPITYIHYIFAHTSNPEQELNSESTPGGTLPITTVYGRKIPTVTLTGYFPYRYPDEFWNDFMPTLAGHRRVNSVKNIFLVGTILTVVKSNVFKELPEGTNWYVKQYTWKRNTQHPDRGEFNLVLLRWFKEITGGA